MQDRACLSRGARTCNYTAHVSQTNKMAPIRRERHDEIREMEGAGLVLSLTENIRSRRRSRWLCWLWRNRVGGQRLLARSMKSHTAPRLSHVKTYMSTDIFSSPLKSANVSMTRVWFSPAHYIIILFRCLWTRILNGMRFVGKERMRLGNIYFDACSTTVGQHSHLLIIVEYH